MKGFYHRLSRSRSLTVLLLIAASLGLGVLSLRFAAVLRADEMFDSYFENHWIAFLNLLPCVWLALTLWFATQRAAVAFALSSLHETENANKNAETANAKSFLLFIIFLKYF